MLSGSREIPSPLKGHQNVEAALAGPGRLSDVELEELHQILDDDLEQLEQRNKVLNDIEQALERVENEFM